MLGSPKFEAVRPKMEDRNERILSGFTLEQQEEIEKKRKVLSSLAFFIGKDFEIPVELNSPGKGWHWDFKNNIIRIDPKDLLEKPMDYLRFVISHEGGHRRITRADFIPEDVWKQPGFSFMMNSIEDPRDNNFVADSYPKFREQMELAYQDDLDIEDKSIEKAKQKLGYQPRFMQAGFEYIKQWFKEVQGKDQELSEELPADVREVVKKTVESARDSWWRYPSKDEADSSEEMIRQYAEASYKINLKKVWPEFKKLVEKDQEDQKIQELLKDMQGEGQEGGESGQGGLPQELKDKLNPEEQKELEEALKKAIEDAKKGEEEADKDSNQGEEEREGKPEPGEPSKGKSGGKPINLDSLTDKLKQKIKEYIDSLPDDQKKELAEKAGKAIKDFEDEVNKELRGKLTEESGEHSKPDQSKDGKDGQETQGRIQKPRPVDREEIDKFRDQVEKSLHKDANAYESHRREVLPIIDKLENDLREIFVARRAHKWQSGFKTGKRIDIKRRIQEKAKGVPAMESKAWQKKELPQEKDYAITILIDLSGSMRGEKIEETFKAVIVLAEVLNRLSINTEIVGFNDRLYEYQSFGESMSKEMRQSMGGMLKEVTNFDGGRANYNDDGWALEQASERLRKQKANEKFLIVLSDGLPEESPQHSGSVYDLSTQVKRIIDETDQKLIGLGIGRGTEHVEKYYPSSLANIPIEEMGRKLADVIREAIENYDKF